MDYVWIAVTFILILCISDLHSHNDKVEKMFPDISDRRQSEKRLELTVNLYGLYLALIICIIMSIMSIVNVFIH